VGTFQSAINNKCSRASTLARLAPSQSARVRLIRLEKTHEQISAFALPAAQVVERLGGVGRTQQYRPGYVRLSDETLTRLHRAEEGQEAAVATAALVAVLHSLGNRFGRICAALNRAGLDYIGRATPSATSVMLSGCCRAHGSAAANVHARPPLPKCGCGSVLRLRVLSLRSRRRGMNFCLYTKPNGVGAAAARAERCGLSSQCTRRPLTSSSPLGLKKMTDTTLSSRQRCLFRLRPVLDSITSVYMWARSVQQSGRRKSGISKNSSHSGGAIEARCADALESWLSTCDREV
jgi:hypothetical protein